MKLAAIALLNILAYAVELNDTAGANHPVVSEEEPYE